MIFQFLSKSLNITWNSSCYYNIMWILLLWLAWIAMQTVAICSVQHSSCHHNSPAANQSWLQEEQKTANLGNCLFGDWDVWYYLILTRAALLPTQIIPIARDFLLLKRPIIKQYDILPGVDVPQMVRTMAVKDVASNFRSSIESCIFGNGRAEQFGQVAIGTHVH